MKSRLAAIEAKMASTVDVMPDPAPLAEVDAAEVLRVLYEAGAFPEYIERAIENDAADATELILAWLEQNRGAVC